MCHRCTAHEPSQRHAEGEWLGMGTGKYLLTVHVCEDYISSSQAVQALQCAGSVGSTNQQPIR